MSSKDSEHMSTGRPEAGAYYAGLYNEAEHKLAELQAQLDSQRKTFSEAQAIEHKKWSDHCDELQATIARLTAENERLKGGQGEAVLFVAVESIEDPECVGMHATRKVNDLQHVPLYTSQPAPVSVVMPTALSTEDGPHYSDNRASELGYLAGYNACLDKVKELNQ
jgi:hypothetical protein